MLMNAEAGLYFKFDEENGIPKNCPGLENFNMEYWTKGDKNWMKRDTVRRAFEMEFPLQDRRLPSTDKAVSEIITDYAAFENMTRNGLHGWRPHGCSFVQCKDLNNIMTCLQA